MIKATSKEIRQLWIDFFKDKGHLQLEASSLIPKNDKSLLWINSGVAALKPYFSGEKKPPRKSLVNYQKSLRTNDIENVGKTSRHHTFFEMLGNFSIGGYFKDQAIEYGYEFLIDVLKMDINKLYITYFEEDDFTFKKWKSLGIKESHLFKNGREENFWDLGVGPCGPDTEIFYDRGEKYDPEKIGIKLLKEDIENDRYIEIWNIVFSQFNNDGNNTYTELKQKNIDTGAGLERITAISQNCPTNFESDLFMPIIEAVESLCDYKYQPNNYFKKDPIITKQNMAFKVIADHIRATCMSIADGIKPANVSRGYIIRMLIRRALRKGLDLGIKDVFLYKLCSVVQKTLPIYKFNIDEVSYLIKKEEEQFIKTIFKGEKLLNDSIKNIKELDAKIAFKLYDTYGYPIEMTKEIVSDKGIALNMDEFYKLKDRHIEVSKSKGNNVAIKKQINSLQLINSKISDFVGYEKLDIQSTILHLFNEEEEIMVGNEKTYVVTKETPFYATSGGQKFDKGFIEQNNKKYEIQDVFKDKHQNHIHVVNGDIKKDLDVRLVVDEEKRLGAARNHSATHLTFAALTKIYRKQIKQLGSSLDHKKLHLDIQTKTKPSQEIIDKIEYHMNQWINESISPEIKYLTPKEVEQLGVLTLEFGKYDRYGAKLRSVNYGPFSFELCGGTHIDNTKNIEDYKITSITSKQAGIYRLFAITGNKLVNQYNETVLKRELEHLLIIINKVKKMDPLYSIEYKDTIQSIKNAQEKVKKDFKIIRKKILSNQTFDLSSVKEIEVNNQKYMILFNYDDMSKIKAIAGELRNKNPNKVIIIHVGKGNGNFVLITAKNIDSKNIFDLLIKKYGGKGGGNALIAQGMIGKINSIDELKESLIYA